MTPDPFPSEPLDPVAADERAMEEWAAETCDHGISLRYPDGREKCLECGAWFKSGWETPTDA